MTTTVAINADESAHPAVCFTQHVFRNGHSKPFDAGLAILVDARFPLEQAILANSSGTECAVVQGFYFLRSRKYSRHSSAG
jgi:hypothetical protein